MMTLKINLRGVMSNALKGLVYPHWILIGFQMRWSKSKKTIVMYSKHVTLFWGVKKRGKKLDKEP